ncbi:hypothetical protein DY000_02005955 [Brassica cretica]|uniref:Uncharacterized protein n=1 Tax=Brassica cretica TaxID=69181 RepID=A0ABQ7CB72_BRACR|nr:hypothetical protein DY000_02005955 [Brassica cretica]
MEGGAFCATSALSHLRLNLNLILFESSNSSRFLFRFTITLTRSYRHGDLTAGRYAAA